MEKSQSYKKCLSQQLRSIFSDMEHLSAMCSIYMNEIPDSGKNNSHSESGKHLFKCEVFQLSVALQFEDIIIQNFLSLDALNEEIKRIEKENTYLTSSEIEKLSNLINDVTENISSRILSSLENIDLRLKRLCEISTTDNISPNNKFNIEETIEKIRVFTEEFDAEKILPDISLIDSCSSIESSERHPIKKSIGERLSKGFRVVEHKMILKNYFPEQDLPGDSGILEIF